LLDTYETRFLTVVVVALFAVVVVVVAVVVVAFVENTVEAVEVVFAISKMLICEEKVFVEPGTKVLLLELRVIPPEAKFAWPEG